MKYACVMKQTTVVTRTVHVRADNRQEAHRKAQAEADNAAAFAGMFGEIVETVTSTHKAVVADVIPIGDAPSADEEARRLASAQVVSGWLHPVYDGRPGGYGVVGSLRELLSVLSSAGLPKPEYVWTCRQIPKVVVDFSDVMGISRSARSIDIYYLEGTDALREAIGEFNAANADKVMWVPDFTTAVTTDKNSLRPRPPCGNVDP